MKKILYFNLLILLISVSVFAQNDGNDLLKKVQNKYNSINSFTTDFKQYIGSNPKVSGKFYFKKDNNLRLETKSSTIVSNGSTNWNYNKNQNKVIISDFSVSDASMFSFKKIIFDYPSKSNVEQKTEKGNNILIITPNPDANLNFQNAKLWINSNNLIQKIQIKENNNSLMTIDLSNYTVNNNLADSEFTFSPPEGSKIIDLRQ